MDYSRELREGERVGRALEEKYNSLLKGVADGSIHSPSSASPAKVSWRDSAKPLEFSDLRKTTRTPRADHISSLHERTPTRARAPVGSALSPGSLTSPLSTAHDANASETIGEAVQAKDALLSNLQSRLYDASSESLRREEELFGELQRARGTVAAAREERTAQDRQQLSDVRRAVGAACVANERLLSDIDSEFTHKVEEIRSWARTEVAASLSASQPAAQVSSPAEMSLRPPSDVAASRAEEASALAESEAVSERVLEQHKRELLESQLHTTQSVARTLRRDVETTRLSLESQTESHSLEMLFQLRARERTFELERRELQARIHGLEAQLARAEAARRRGVEDTAASVTEIVSQLSDDLGTATEMEREAAEGAAATAHQRELLEILEAELAQSRAEAAALAEENTRLQADLAEADRLMVGRERVRALRSCASVKPE
eukprot:gnl/Chilomastix_cuspidata/1821.p1 GENE.gnl/Chilomastix_cuspidata/1821~~gnl/Chilomastix_cuspidata/1821.p1  ORF type:complete len:437 (-),score=115.90 gnl/Chilomastix_cuspidata/1821:8-1318(-)